MARYWRDSIKSYQLAYLVLDPTHAQLIPDCIIALHAFLSDGLMADPTAVGRLRRRAVEIGGSVYLPVALPQRLEELFGIVIQMAAEIHDPFVSRATEFSPVW